MMFDSSSTTHLIPEKPKKKIKLNGGKTHKGKDTRSFLKKLYETRWYAFEILQLIYIS